MADIRKRLEDISEEEIIGELYDLAMNSKRPTARLAAITRLAEMKGMLKGSGGSDALDTRLDEMLENSAAKKRGLRKVE